MPDTIGGSTSEEGRLESDRFGQSRSASHRADPEPTELTSSTALIRTISEESLPREMLEQQEPDDFFDEKLAKDARNNMKKRLDDWETSGTPPPSPEPRIKPSTALDPDHSTLFKILKEEAAEESNVSSMTPSLTELEAALSDMLEKEEPQEQVPKILEPVIEELSNNDRNGEAARRQLAAEGERKVAGRKVSFCSWEESIAESRRSEAGPSANLDSVLVSAEETEAFPTDIPPKKPNRSNKSPEEDFSDLVPTPPRRKNKSGPLLGVARREPETAQNGTTTSDHHLHNDRLI